MYTKLLKYNFDTTLDLFMLYIERIRKAGEFSKYLLVQGLDLTNHIKDHIFFVVVQIGNSITIKHTSIVITKPLCS